MLAWLLLWNPLIGLWAVWCTQAVLCAIQVSQFSRLVARPARPGFDAYRPKAAVIVPFRGHDVDLPRNVRALITQDYGEHRLVFVVESDDDPAKALIEDELTNHDPAALPPVDLVVAGPAPPDTGQKVHNQLAALDFLEKQNDDSEVWAFADSDAVPGPHWLAKLVGPLLQHERVGATTGYRWLMPELRAQRPRPAAAIASVINAAAACLVSHPRLTQCWGGSMAVRADFARQHGLTDRLRRSIDDDYQLTHLCRDADRRIYFVPGCLVPSPIDFTWKQLHNFGRRQYLITRVYHPTLYRKALAVVAFYVVMNLAALGVLLFAALTGRTVLAVFAAVALLIVGVANQVRAAYRRRAIANAFGRDHLHYLRATLRLDRFATLPVMIVHLA
ncbi:MAG: glycosyltransferase family 2 protein, partial [Planctomycetota bacterium]